MVSHAENRGTKNADCGAFIDYMLGEILRTLKTSTSQPTSRTSRKSGGVNGGVSGGVNEVLACIREHEGSRANTIAPALAMPLRTVERHLAVLKRNGEIVFKGAQIGRASCRERV